MKRIFNDYAYGNGPRDSCWWDETCDMPDAEILQGSLTVDVAIIGGGFTGLSAALELASQGAQVALLESHFLGWGASGRNGGFCCLGGGLAEDDELDKSYGRARRLEFRKLEKAAVDHVEMLIERLDLDVDRHSRGETELAHRPKDMVDLRTKAERVFENYGVEPEIIEERDLGRHGMIGGHFLAA